MSRKKKDLPTYCKDITGNIKQWDERDIIFARTDLSRYFGTESREYKTYYKAHADIMGYDTRVNNIPGLGKTGGVDTPMFEAQFETVSKIAPESFVDGEPFRDKAMIPPESASKKIKAMARLLGADLAGIGPLRQEWVYSHVGRSFGNRDGFQKTGSPVDLTGHLNAIALGFRMNYELIQHAPDFPILLATARGYASGAWVSIQLAQYIRMLGYSARAHHLYNYRVLAVPVAADCGLGELSRAGFLLTKEMGLGLRLSAVTTDMPLDYDSPVDIGAQSFCDSCEICADFCPSGAIPRGGKTEYNGVKKWKLDEKKCYMYWRTAGTDCGLCMAACPWTKPSNLFHRFMASLAAIKGPHQLLMVKADMLFYGKSRSRRVPAGARSVTGAQATKGSKHKTQRKIRSSRPDFLDPW